MPDIMLASLPPSALLNEYASQEGCYTDCYVAKFPGNVDLFAFVEAFYTTPLFKIERAILSAAVNKSSSDMQARQVVNGDIDYFAAWTVERRAPDQLLMCDTAARTRSWFMVEDRSEPDEPSTLLYFGSAVVPAPKRSDKKADIGVIFHALLGFHKIYSRALLASAKSRLMKNTKKPNR